MKRLTIQIDTTNAAFEDDVCAELRRILDVLSDKLPDNYLSAATIPLRDVNGNYVGFARCEQDERK
jgi:hypothetical protein